MIPILIVALVLGVLFCGEDEEATPTPTLSPTQAPTPQCTPGDVNQDGVIDGLDMIRVKKIIQDLEPETCGADANGDDVVDGRDVIRIKETMLGIE
jgi:hypothetical protein